MGPCEGLSTVPAFHVPVPSLAAGRFIGRSSSRRRARCRSSPSTSSPSRIRACIETPPVPQRGNVTHESWNVYERDGCCVICAGEGHTVCLYCFGEGSVTIGANIERDSIPCPQCQGSKEVHCVRCDGTGIRPSTRYDCQLGTYVRNPTNAEVRKPPQKAPLSPPLEFEEAEDEKEQAVHVKA